MEVKVTIHEAVYKQNNHPDRFAWECHCTGCSWVGVGPTKASVELMFAGHDIDFDLNENTAQGEDQMSTLRQDNLLTRENLNDIFSMLSPTTRDLVRKEIHEAHQTASEDLTKEKVGSHAREEVRQQEALALAALQSVDQATAEYTQLDQPVTPITPVAPIQA